MSEDIVQHLDKAGAAPVAPSLFDLLGRSRKPWPPVGEELRRDDRSIMGPVLEQVAVFLQQPF